MSYSRYRGRSQGGPAIARDRPPVGRSRDNALPCPNKLTEATLKSIYQDVMDDWSNTRDRDIDTRKPNTDREGVAQPYWPDNLTYFVPRGCTFSAGQLLTVQSMGFETVSAAAGAHVWKTVPAAAGAHVWRVTDTTNPAELILKDPLMHVPSFGPSTVALHFSDEYKAVKNDKNPKLKLSEKDLKEDGTVVALVEETPTVAADKGALAAFSGGGGAVVAQLLHPAATAAIERILKSKNKTVRKLLVVAPDKIESYYVYVYDDERQCLRVIVIGVDKLENVLEITESNEVLLTQSLAAQLDDRENDTGIGKP